jgi:hypothetical protein
MSEKSHFLPSYDGVEFQRVAGSINMSEVEFHKLMAERQELRDQVREFRHKCDPSENIVLVTMAEFLIP